MRTTRRALTLITTLAVGLALAAPAMAEAPSEVIEIDETIEGRWEVGQEPILGDEPAIAAACGVERLDVALDFRLRASLYGDPENPDRVVEHRREDVSFTNPDTGGRFIVDYRNKADLTRPTETVDPEEGTLTLGFVDRFTGLNYRLRAPGIGVIAMDSGRVTVGLTLVIDLASGDATPTYEILDQSGRFTWGGPEGGPDAEQLELICRALDGDRGRGSAEGGRGGGRGR